MFSLLIVFLFCSPSKTIDDNEQNLASLHNNFVASDKEKFSINTKYKPSNAKSIELSHTDGFKIISTVSTKKGTIIELSKTSNKRHRSLMISFLDDKDTLRNIQVFFYSKLINILNIEKDEEIVFSRIQDTVPPLFFIKNSMQDGLFKICKENKIIQEFSSLDYLYFISYYYKSGTYSICEVDCGGSLFNYSLQD